MEGWRLLPYHLGDSDLHFTLSDALARRAVEPTVWWHATDRPTLILGPSQTRFDAGACEAAGVLVVRRQAGGTAVYAAEGVLGLDVMLPFGHPLAIPDIVEAYRWLGEVWVDATRSLGAAARLVSIEEARAAGRAEEIAALRMACFGGLSPYEVVVGDRKLVGLAQVRRRAGVLFQSAIHLHFDPAPLAALLPAPDRAAVQERLRQRVIGLDEALRRPADTDEVMRRFEDALGQQVRVALRPGEWTAAEMAPA